jgi:hypothetical protein
MTGTTAQPSGQAPSQPASTTQSGSPSAPESILGGDPAAAPTPADPAAAAAAKPKDGEAPKADDGKPGEGKDPASKAPEKYDFKFADDVAVDTAALEAFSPVLREAGLTQEQAQKLADVYAAQIAQQSTAFAEKLKDESFALEQAANMFAPQRAKWADSLKTDKDIGGKNYDQNVVAMQRAIGRFGTPELKQLLNVTGLGNHPELARFCLKVGQAISEDNPQAGTPGGGERKSHADVFYAS